MNKHTESIVVFGVIVPGVLLVAVLGAVLFARSKLNAGAEAKLAAFREYEQTMASLKTVESEFAKREEPLAFWKEHLQKELIQSLTGNLREAMQPYSDDQLRQTELSRPSNTSQFAAMTDNHYDRFRLSFEGGFGPMQRVLAELETRMPQLVLESLNTSPMTQTGNETGPPKLKFVVTYLSWREES